MTWTLRTATVGVLVGVYQFNTSDIGAYRQFYRRSCLSCYDRSDGVDCQGVACMNGRFLSFLYKSTCCKESYLSIYTSWWSNRGVKLAPLCRIRHWTKPVASPLSSVVERVTCNDEVGCSIQPVGMCFYKCGPFFVVAGKSVSMYKAQTGMYVAYRVTYDTGVNKGYTKES